VHDTHEAHEAHEALEALEAHEAHEALEALEATSLPLQWLKMFLCLTGATLRFWMMNPNHSMQ
jgi:hypothetical protein